MGLGWGVAYQVFMNGLPASFPRHLSQFIFWGLFLSSWVGAKTLFLWTRPDALTLIEELSFWTGGGFVFYGGLILGGCFMLTLRFFRPEASFTAEQSLLIALPLGHAIGRVGCFLAGCCYGKVSSASWAIHQHGVNRHPTQLYEALGLGILTLILSKLRHSKKDLLSTYLLGYGSLRLVLEFLRGDEIRGSLWGYPPSQVLSLLFLGAGLVVYFKRSQGLRSLH